MECPYCGGEMERGFLQSPHRIFWSKKSKLFFMPGGDDVKITPFSYFSPCENENSYLCRKCSKIVIDLG